ncbi:hypothetical protein BDZ97DRAFT_1760038 [Flammula alnicola]|nr:hypothetical protein BDZ97DRAFT_1760038 [Flammula alnicola]
MSTYVLQEGRDYARTAHSGGRCMIPGVDSCIAEYARGDYTTRRLGAATARLARWALSSDDTFQEVGSTTGIRYFNDLEEYLTILETGLRQKKKSVINIIKQWDEKIFPNSDSSLVTG